MKKIIFLLLLFFQLSICFSQQHYWVFYTDKQNTTFNPITYFDAKALERKVMFGIAINDSTDYPVNSTYIQETEKRVESISVVSRWFNCANVVATEQQINQVKQLPFVKNVISVNTIGQMASMNKDTSVVESETQKLAKKQLMRMQGEKFIEKGINGKGIRIAIFDGGFPEVDTHPAFEHIRKEKRILKTYDFTKKKEFVYAYNSHGLSTFSNIAGIIDGVQYGLATGAEFLLARTEINSEPFAEEQYWLAAAEWADKNGAQIISSSLGYTANRYFPEQMDGEHSLVVKAANMAASKGILVINAMGNEGDSKWRVLSTPADADSILSVGGIEPSSNLHIYFSSYGPTKDGRLKPNVCSFGKAAVATTKGSTQISFGTSFSTPLVAGFAACAWQVRIGASNMTMKSEIEHSADLFPYFDYAHGYGVPQASYFTEKKDIEKKVALYKFEQQNDSLKIVYLGVLDSSQIQRGKREETFDSDGFNRLDFQHKNPDHYLYFHIAKPDGTLARYGVIYVYSANALSIPMAQLPKGYVFRISYKNGFQEWKQN